jgi:aspartate-semialdehyde dehydrogenase
MILKIKKENTMDNKIEIGILGATGMVGQNFIRLLNGHPWFDIKYLAASPNSAGKKYHEAVSNRWLMKEDIPEYVRNLTVHDANKIEEASGKCKLLFSALEMDKESLKKMEMDYAKNDFIIVSNNGVHRNTGRIPMIIPEINHDHLDIIPFQQKKYGFKKGLIVVKPNCSIQSFMIPIYSLMEAGYKVDRMFVTTMQAISGMGYPGCSAYDILENIIPNLKEEEEKAEKEPLKIFGKIVNEELIIDDSIRISAQCSRVPVIDGHTACVSVSFSEKKPSLDDIKNIWTKFRGLPQNLDLPSAPEVPIIFRDEKNRPQPQKDRNNGKGMAVTVGSLQECNLFDIKFVGLSHNTIRGAAGGSILTAELLKAKGFF